MLIQPNLYLPLKNYQQKDQSLFLENLTPKFGHFSISPLICIYIYAIILNFFAIKNFHHLLTLQILQIRKILQYLIINDLLLSNFCKDAAFTIIFYSKLLNTYCVEMNIFPITINETYIF